MNLALGIRREDKNDWEARVPIIPDHAKKLNDDGISVVVQPSKIRAYREDEYRLAQASVSESLQKCPVIFAVKEIPQGFFEKDKTYVFFSHVIKGQKNNMPMLKKMMELSCNLIDYEKVTDKNGKRLIFFGRYAGLAGMIDTLWAFGKRLYSQGLDTPFAKIKKSLEYKNLHEAKQHIKKVGEEIKIYGFDQRLMPVTCGFTGYGNVSNGAQEIFDLLPHEEITPDELLTLNARPNLSRNVVYKVVFKEEHMVKPLSDRDKFKLQDYFDHPEKYASAFDKYVEHLTLIANCIYWDSRYPRLVTKNHLKRLYSGSGDLKLKVIGDITCDVGGSMECTVKSTDSGDPIYVYNPASENVSMGYSGEGVVVLAVDNLPCELPIDSSRDFSNALLPFIPAIVKADYSADFKKLRLPNEIKKALVLHRGKLTPDFQYISKYI